MKLFLRFLCKSAGYIGLLFIFGNCAPQRQVAKTDSTAYPLSVENLRIRDPFILVDRQDKSYFLHANSNPHFRAYKSKDLIHWKDLGYSFTAGNDFWGKSDFWAPDVYAYKNKYYLLATFSAPGKKRGTSILMADHPVGPFQPLLNKASTPETLMSLDGTLYVDRHGDPWIIFCHEWLEATNGEVLAQGLSADLKETLGEPIVLFTANAAPWTGTITAHNVTGYVTDAPFPYLAKNGELLMLWSGFKKDGKYAIGVVRSVSGDLLGPWKHDPEPLNNDDGGHAMLFKDLSGKLKISYHSPNSGSQERVTIRDIVEDAGKLKIME